MLALDYEIPMPCLCFIRPLVKDLCFWTYLTNSHELQKAEMLDGFTLLLCL